MFDDYYREEFEDDRNFEPENVFNRFFEDQENMPERPRSHELETESFAFMRGILPFEWTIEIITHDYGKDLLIEIFANGKATGIEFIAQTKSTDKKIDTIKNPSRRISTKTLTYLKNKDLPSMLVYYSSKSRRAYWLWVTDYINHYLSEKKPNWESQKTVTVGFSKDRTFGYHSIDEIAFYLHVRRLPKNLSAKLLIDNLNSYSDDWGKKNLFGMLPGQHIWSIAKYLDSLQDNELTRKGVILPSYTWEDQLFQNEITRNAIIDLTFRKAIIDLEKTRDLISASADIYQLHRHKALNQMRKLIQSWWEIWLADPDLDMVFSNHMLDFMPSGNLQHDIDIQIYDLFEIKFGDEIHTLDKIIEAYRNVDGEYDIESLIWESNSRFIRWLIDEQDHTMFPIRWVVERLGFSNEIKDVLIELYEYASNYAEGMPSPSQVIKNLHLLPNIRLSSHIKNLANKPELAIDGSMLMFHTPNYVLWHSDKIEITKDEDIEPRIFEDYPEIHQITLDNIAEVDDNESKYFCSKITYPENNEKLSIHLGGNLNYRTQQKLEYALNNQFGKTKSLISLYEKPGNKYDWKYDLFSMITIKNIVITKDNKILFVRRLSGKKAPAYFPGLWIPGVDRQMLSFPISNQEALFESENANRLIKPDEDFFAGGVRGLYEELAVDENMIEDIGFLALFREIDTYITNVLLVSHLNVSSDRISRLIPSAEEYVESREHKFRPNDVDLLAKLMTSNQYRNESSGALSGGWHPDARLRLLLASYSLHGINSTLNSLNEEYIA